MSASDDWPKPLEEGYYLARQKGPCGDFKIVGGPHGGSIHAAAAQLVVEHGVPLDETFGMVYSKGHSMRLFRRQKADPPVETIQVRP